MALLSKRKEGSVLVVELTRPEQGNALNRQLQRELTETWQEFDDADDLMVAVLQGSGDVFSIGHDVEELATAQGPDASPVPESGMFPLNLRKPVLAAIEGPCYGLGFELALSCDLRFAGQGALFGCPDRNLFVPYQMASVLLPRMTFLGLSLDLLFSGKVLDAHQAQGARLVNQVAPTGRAAPEAIAAATTMAARFADAGAFRKKRIHRLLGVSLPYAMDLAKEPA